MKPATESMPRDVPRDAAPSDAPRLVLGVAGFDYRDLHTPEGLARLHAAFLDALAADDAALSARFAACRAGEKLAAPAESQLLVDVAAHVSRFVGRLFGVERELAELRAGVEQNENVFRFKHEFLVRRAFRRGAPNRPTAQDFPALEREARAVLAAAFAEETTSSDPERALAEAVCALLDEERALAATIADKKPATEPAAYASFHARARKLSAASSVSPVPAVPAELTAALSHGEPPAPPAASLAYARTLLDLFDRWSYARAKHPEAARELKRWPTFKLPLAVELEHLVEVAHPDAALPEAIEGLPEHARRRDGFALTDRRMNAREVQGEVEYCLYCHKTQKDTCSHGFKEKAGPAPFKKNALGTILAGCPLEERISEAHALQKDGDTLGALAMIALDNPMLPGTGHRICNDCMKACVFQKQEPVNIPQIETRVLTDVLALPWGFELYSLLAKWNPLHVERPFPAPYNGKNVLVVGQGPAGYTLAHHLVNEGFGVVAIDGLKIEPLPDALVGPGFQPIHDVAAVTKELDERVLAGFGGVAEYGITVRWDKRFLDLLHLQMRRREGFKLYGGIRFGGTLDLDDAWMLGFDHVAIAAGAGKPTIVEMKNNLARGIRQASDFLMALQLTGAFKKDALANLEVKLPAMVIGGGLTAIDTATELAAYYPVQVEKTLLRWETLVAEQGEGTASAGLDAAEQADLATFLEHGRAVRAERARAAAAGEAPDFASLVKQWGGVSIAYRKSMTDSPAYRLNHEEIAKCLEEGIRFLERLSPAEAVLDEGGAVKAMRFERMAVSPEGKWSKAGVIELPARTVCIAAGTSPNVTYNRELPGTFAQTKWGFFQSHRAIVEGGQVRLEPVEAKDDWSTEAGFFTSYLKDNHTVSYFGDNHPVYAGSVVKAMASAKDGYPHVRALFADELAKLTPETQDARDRGWARLCGTLDAELLATVHAVNRLTPTIVEVVIHAPLAARQFKPGQFYRLQNYETLTTRVDGIPLLMEGLALTGAWTDPERGLMATIVLEMGASSRLCAALRPGEPVVLMGPTGAPSKIPRGQNVLLAGGGLGNAVLFSISRALRAAGSRVVYFAGYRNAADVFKADDIEHATDQVIWAVDSGPALTPRRPQDRAFVGNIVQAMLAYAKGELGEPLVPLSTVQHILAIGSDRMMAAVQEARHGVLQPHLRPDHEAIASINSPMQCMMKEICAQCLQRHVVPAAEEPASPATGGARTRGAPTERFVFSCFNQDQAMDLVDFKFLRTRLKANALSEKLADKWLRRLLARGNVERV